VIRIERTLGFKLVSILSAMSFAKSLLVLFLAAILEAGGDAIVRSGIHAATARKLPLFAAGAVILFGYGYAVNAPPWDFGRLLGVYVVFFFLVAQAIAWIAFHQKPGPAILLGGTFIVIGGAIISYGSLAK
jgi:small multidrug resistance family-3 protein